MSNSGALGKNRLQSLLGIELPIVQAPMAGGPTTAELVIAVSNAGALGSLAAARVPQDRLRAMIRSVKAGTDRPFAVNFLIPSPVAQASDVNQIQAVLDPLRGELGLPAGPREVAPPSFTIADGVALAIEEGVPIISFGLGNPTAFVEQIHAAGSRVISMVSTVQEAQIVASAGVDAIVAQGAESGGHRSTFDIGPLDPYPLVGTMALVPQIVDAVSIPVIAGGGIMDGRGVAAALALGASAAQLGTRFLTARESGTAPAYRARLLEATEVDTAITTAFSGRPTRSLRNKVSRAVEASGVTPASWPMQSLLADDLFSAAIRVGDADYFPLQTGQGLRLLKDGQSAVEIIAELVREYREVIDRLS